jgi:hypothetical protein
MAQLRGGACLAEELFTAALGELAGAWDLDGHLAIELGVVGMPDTAERSAADFFDELKVGNHPLARLASPFRSLGAVIAWGQRGYVVLCHVDQAELATTAGAVHTLEVRVIDQFDAVLTVGTADLHGNGNPGDVSHYYATRRQGDASEGGQGTVDPNFTAEICTARDGSSLA